MGGICLAFFCEFYPDKERVTRGAPHPKTLNLQLTIRKYIQQHAKETNGQIGAIYKTYKI